MSCQPTPSTLSHFQSYSKFFLRMASTFWVPCPHNCSLPSLQTSSSGVGRRERGSLTTAFFTRPAQMLQGPLIWLPRVVPYPSSRTKLVLSATRSRLASCPLSSLHAAPRPDQNLDQARKPTCFCKPHNVRGPHSSPCSNWDSRVTLLCGSSLS